MKDVIHIAIPVDGKQYRRYAEVTAASARNGSSLPVEIHFIDWAVIDRNRLERFGKWHGSAIAWSRLFLSEILPADVDWVISCDADVLFRGDIAKLWALRDDRYVVMMSRDSMPPWYKENPTIGAYCHEHNLEVGEILCSGITMVNLKRWREEGWQAKVDGFVSEHGKAGFLDQLVLNVVFKSVKTALPRPWGCFSGDLNADVDYDGDCAIHYVSDPPWRRSKPTQLMSDAVVLWRKDAGMSCGGWRRWAYCALKATSGLWTRNRWMAWHFRNARPRKDVLLVMHKAPYRDAVTDLIAAAGNVDVFPILGNDPNHRWAGFGGSEIALWCPWLTLRLVRQFCLGGSYRFVVWPAYMPHWLLIPICVSALLGKRYAISLDTIKESCGRFGKMVKRHIFTRAEFLWVPGKAARRFLEEEYGIAGDKIVEGLYEVPYGR